MADELRSGPTVRPMGFGTPVLSSRQLTPTTYAIEVEKPAEFRFLPTQFTFLQLRTDFGVDQRPMSLATSPTRPNLEYAVRVSDSPYKRAFANLRPGDQVGVMGPLGDFVLDEARPAVLVGGGIGITPLKGMAEYAADRGLPIPLRLVYSSRTTDEIVYREELAALEHQNPHLQVLHTLTSPVSSGWIGPTGRIDRELLREAARDLDNPVYYVSGTPSMVVAAIRLLQAEDIPRDSVVVEAFRGYA